MFTLIKRELEDNYGTILVAFLLSGLSSSLIYLFTEAKEPNQGPLLYLSAFFGILILLLFCAIGVTQMYLDRQRKISSFLTMLAVSREKILIAKIITGVITIFITLLPLIIITVIIFSRIERDMGIVVNRASIGQFLKLAFLLSLACYFLGLQYGWSQRRFFPSMGSFGLSLILISLVLIKGLSMQTAILLIAVILCSLILAWHKFMSTEV